MATKTETETAPATAPAKKKTAAKPPAPKASSKATEGTEVATTAPTTVEDTAKKEKAEKLHEQALDARHRIDEATFEMAEVLFTIYDESLYVQLGFKTWKEYVEKQLSFAIRKAQYLVQMWAYYGVKLAAFPEVREKVQALGWTKAKELVEIVDEKNVDEWCEKAGTMSAVQLVQVARETLAAAQIEGAKAKEKPSDGPSLKNKSFRLEEGQLANVEKALAKAGELANSEKSGHQLDRICLDFLATNAGVSKGKRALREFLKKVEANLGVLLVAIDPESNAVVYGNSTVDKLAEGATQ
jgi:hypothetical protein